MACEPTTDLDDQGAAGDRLGAPADGGRGMDSLASGADLSAVSRPDHRIGVPYPVAYTPLFDSNAKRYGGFAAEPPARVVRGEEVHWHDREFSVLRSPHAARAFGGDPKASAAHGLFATTQGKHSWVATEMIEFRCNSSPHRQPLGSSLAGC
ncbi:MAG: hypothetical protein WCC41_23040 [Rhodomicrobium sp.]